MRRLVGLAALRLAKVVVCPAPAPEADVRVAAHRKRHGLDLRHSAARLRGRVCPVQDAKSGQLQRADVGKTGPRKEYWSGYEPQPPQSTEAGPPLTARWSRSTQQSPQQNQRQHRQEWAATWQRTAMSNEAIAASKCPPNRNFARRRRRRRQRQAGKPAQSESRHVQRTGAMQSATAAVRQRGHHSLSAARRRRTAEQRVSLGKGRLRCRVPRRHPGVLQLLGGRRERRPGLVALRLAAGERLLRRRRPSLRRRLPQHHPAPAAVKSALAAGITTAHSARRVGGGQQR